MAKMKLEEVLNKFIEYLLNTSIHYDVDVYENDILAIDNIDTEREEIIKDFLFKEFPNSYGSNIKI